MAIKISGNTVIDDSQNITATGSGTFSNTVMRGTFSSGSDTARGSILGDGMVAAQQPAASPAGAVMWEGYYGTDVTSRIRADGSATFNGETIVQGTGKFFLKRTDAGSTTCAIRDDNLRIFDNPVSYDDFKISLENDGSATFASGGSVINSYGQLVITRSDSNAFPSLTINSAGTTTNTIDLNGDGSATFASSVECNSELRVLRSGNRVNLGGSDTLAVFENNGNFAINWDGSASFDGTITAGPIDISSSTGYGAQVDIGSNAATIKAQCIQTASQYTELFAGYMGTNKYFAVNAQGDATFNGTITANGGYALSQLTELT